MSYIDIRAKLALVCEEAGLGVMADVLDVILDRETVPDRTLASLDADDIYSLYEQFVGPAIDRIEDDLNTGAVIA